MFVFGAFGGTEVFPFDNMHVFKLDYRKRIWSRL